MGKTAAALGQGTTMVHNGKTYYLSPWTYKIQGTFERYIEAEVRQAYKEMAPFMTADERKEELAKIRKEIATGVYTFGSTEMAECLQSLRHLKYLLFLMLQPNHPEMTVELASEITDAQMEEVMAAMAQANADPSSGAAASKDPTPPTQS